MSLTKELTKAILRGPLKLIGLIPLWPPPLTKQRPVGVAHSEREISNFDGMSLTKELTKAILRRPLKFHGLLPLLNYNVI